MLRRRDLPAVLLPVLSACRRQAGFGQITFDIRHGAYPNTHAVLVERENQLIYEHYFTGPDERWGQSLGTRVFDANSLHDLRSCSKSVTAALLGIALASDFDKAVERPIGSFFPKRKLRPELDAVTLHHVLTMTAGIEWNEMTVPYTDPKNDERQMGSVKDPVGLVLARPLRNQPGSVWYYNGGLTQVLAGAVMELTNKPLDAYAREVLFSPLGIAGYEWLGVPTWDPPMPAAASGLRMRARDLARFGSLFLNQGKWQDRQIVPYAWVNLCTRRYVQSLGDWHGRAGWGYGYQWWIGTPAGFEVAAAVGNGNQRVFVVPKERTVVTIFAGEYNKFEGHSEHLFGDIMAVRA